MFVVKHLQLQVSLKPHMLGEISWTSAVGSLSRKDERGLICAGPPARDDDGHARGPVGTGGYSTRRPLQMSRHKQDARHSDRHSRVCRCDCYTHMPLCRRSDT